MKKFLNLQHQYQNFDTDIAVLLKSWKKILVSGILGAMAGYFLFLILPTEYEAIAQIKLGQIANNQEMEGKIILGVDIESPGLLIARLQMPSTYSINEIKKCGMEEKIESREVISKILKVNQIQTKESIVELKIKRKSADEAANCLMTIINKIKEDQRQIIEPYINEAKIQKAENMKLLKEAQAITMNFAKELSGYNTAQYLTARENVVYLTEQIVSLNKLINSADKRQLKLISPIFIPSKPVSIDKGKMLLMGLIIGVFTGLLLVTLFEIYARRRNITN